MNKTSRWIPRAIYLPLALVPFIYLVVMVIRYAVDVPYLDGWELVPLLEKLNHHTLTVRDLWVQHNEHRLIFPQIIMLVLAKLTSWNIFYELGTSLALACGTFLVIAKQVEVTGESMGKRWIVLALPAVAVLIFSLRQSENWLWGWQLQMFLSALAIVSSIYFLGNPPFRRWRVAASMCLAVVASFSFANGMMIWPIGLFILAVAPFYEGKLRWKCLGAWLVLAGIVTASYLYQYHKPPDSPKPDFLLKSFITFVNYVLSYLGSPTSPVVEASRKAGIFIAILTPVVILGLLRLRYVRFGQLIPYVGICLYVFGSALMTGAGRCGFGVEQALSPRYNTYVGLLWSCNLILLVMLALGRKPAEEAVQTKKRKYRKPEGTSALQTIVSILAVVAALGILVSTGQASIGDVAAMTAFNQRLVPGRDQVVRMVSWTSPSSWDRTCLLYPWMEKAVPRAKIMAREHWSVFRHGIPEVSAPPGARPPQ